MRKYLFAGAAMGLLCLVATAAVAQDSAPVETPPAAEAAPAASAPAPAPAVVPNGTPIIVEITDLITTKTALPNDMFNLKLAEPVMLGTVIAIPAGTPGKGQVIDAGKPGMGGKPGKLVLAARYLDYQGKQIPIRGLKLGLTAKDNSGEAVAVGVLAGVVGLAITGDQMQVAAGTKARAKLGIDFVPAADAPAPQPDTVAPAATPAETPPATAPAAAPQTNP